MSGKHKATESMTGVASWEARLRLIFWAVREALGVIVLAALAVYFIIVALIEGRLSTELLGHPTPWQLPPDW